MAPAILAALAARALRPARRHGADGGRRMLEAVAGNQRRRGETADERRARKEATKREKQQKREKAPKLKPCDICGEHVDLLVRCQVDETRAWKLVCGKKCWKQVSGGVTDGDADHPHYKYGGLWKAHGA